MVPTTKEELNKLVTQQTLETYEELAPPADPPVLTKKKKFGS